MHTPKPLYRSRAFFLSLACTAVLIACGPSAAPPAGPPGAGMPPAQVGVVTVAPGDWGLSTELPGRLEASRQAQVRARVAGIVQRQLFNEGSFVQAGQPLFEIDASTYKASVDGALANLAKAEANALQAHALAERYKPLVEAKAVSQQEWVAAQAAHKLAQADIGVATAALQSARINLNFASVTAPIAGTVAGLFEGTANVAAPPLIIYYLALGLGPALMVQAMQICFLVGKMSQFAVLTLHGGVTSAQWLTTLPLCAVAVAAGFAGVRVRNRIDATRFRHWVKRALALIAFALLAQYVYRWSSA